jgi:hypothetical protein
MIFTLTRLLVSVTCLLIFTLSSNAQIHEGGIMLGGSYYIGDLNPYGHFKNTNFAFGAVYRQSPNDRISYRANLNYGRVEGYDSQSTSELHQARNLHFRSNIVEVSTVLEISYFPYIIGDNKKPFTPYLFAGLSYFRMNPKAELDGNWIELQPLSTEGQNTSANPSKRRYSLNQMAIPFGLGFKFNLSKTLSMNIEWGMRRTFTDYLDDVSGVYPDKNILHKEVSPLAVEFSDRSIEKTNPSGYQRGSSNSTDWYIFTGISITYRIGGAADTCPIW